MSQTVEQLRAAMIQGFCDLDDVFAAVRADERAKILAAEHCDLECGNRFFSGARCRHGRSAREAQP